MSDPAGGVGVAVGCEVGDDKTLAVAPSGAIGVGLAAAEGMVSADEALGRGTAEDADDGPRVAVGVRLADGALAVGAGVLALATSTRTKATPIAARTS